MESTNPQASFGFAPLGPSNGLYGKTGSTNAKRIHGLRKVQAANGSCRYGLVLAFLLFTWGTLSAQEPYCQIKYVYNAAGDRVQRYWYCWPLLESKPHGDGRLANNALKLTPNPASTMLTIQLDSAIVEGRMEILDLAGQVVRSHAMRGLSVEEDLMGLVPGSYYIRVTEEGAQLIAKFVVTP